MMRYVWPTLIILVLMGIYGLLGWLTSDKKDKEQ